MSFNELVKSQRDRNIGKSREEIELYQKQIVSNIRQAEEFLRTSMDIDSDMVNINTRDFHPNPYNGQVFTYDDIVKISDFCDYLQSISARYE